MHARVVGAIGVLLATATVAQSWRWFAPEVGCWITLEKVPASWEDALRSCQLDDAILASPLNTPLLDYMQSLIAVHNHSAAYFIGTRANRSDSQKVHYVSIEGRRLDEMPRAVVDAIDQLDLSQGDCLCMDRRGIRAVSCWDHLPYICYSNETTECGSAPMMPTTYTSTSATSTSPSTTSTSPSTTSTSPPTTTTSSTTPPPPPPPAPMMPTTSTSTSSTSTSLSTTSTSPSTTTTSSTPPPGYKYYPTTGSYYKVHQRRSTWYEANTTCASEGAHVLVINDAAEAAIVSHIMKDATGTFKYTWTGLRYNRPGGVMEWRTVNGERLSDVYHVWFNGYSHNDEERTCAAYSTRYKRLLYETCEYRYYNMCELTVQQQQ